MKATLKSVKALFAALGRPVDWEEDSPVVQRKVKNLATIVTQEQKEKLKDGDKKLLDDIVNAIGSGEVIEITGTDKAKPKGGKPAAKESSRNGAAPAKAGKKGKAVSRSASGRKESVKRNQGKNGLSQFQAALEVMSKKTPMTCKEIVEEMARKKLYPATGVSPHQALSGSLQRDVMRNKKNASVRRAKPGQWCLA